MGRARDRGHGSAEHDWNGRVCLVTSRISQKNLKYRTKKNIEKKKFVRTEGYKQLE